MAKPEEHTPQEQEGVGQDLSALRALLARLGGIDPDAISDNNLHALINVATGMVLTTSFELRLQVLGADVHDFVQHWSVCPIQQKELGGKIDG